MNIINKIKKIGAKNAIYLTEILMSSIILSSTATIMLVSTIPSLLGVSMLCFAVCSTLLFFVQK